MPYGFIVLIGGLLGFMKKGSIVSLAAGGGKLFKLFIWNSLKNKKFDEKAIQKILKFTVYRVDANTPVAGIQLISILSLSVCIH